MVAREVGTGVFFSLADAVDAILCHVDDNSTVLNNLCVARVRMLIDDMC